MINPSEVGKAGEMVRLRTLESVWIQGKLRMWGRWSYIGGGSSGNMFNQLLASKKITKSAINEALRRMKRQGITRQELAAFLEEILRSKNKSHLAFCSDSEASVIDGVIARILKQDAGLLYVLRQRYTGPGKSKRLMAEELQEKHPEWCFMTCRRRIDTWLSLIEAMLYAPMCDAFNVNSERFSLRDEPESD